MDCPIHHKRMIKHTNIGGNSDGKYMCPDCFNELPEPTPMNEQECKIFQFGYEQGKATVEYKLEERVRILEEKMQLLEPTGY